MSIFKHFINETDYEKLIKIEAKKTAPFVRAVDITKNPKKVKVSSQSKVKKLRKRNS